LKSGQMLFFIEVKNGNFFLGNGTNQLLYALSALSFVARRKQFIFE